MNEFHECESEAAARVIETLTPAAKGISLARGSAHEDVDRRQRCWLQRGKIAKERRGREMPAQDRAGERLDFRQPLGPPAERFPGHRGSFDAAAD